MDFNKPRPRRCRHAIARVTVDISTPGRITAGRTASRHEEYTVRRPRLGSNRDSIEMKFLVAEPRRSVALKDDDRGFALNSRGNRGVSLMHFQ